VLRRAHASLERGSRRALERDAQRLALLRERLRRGPALLVERRRAGVERTGARLAALSPRATLERGYAIVRARDGIVRASDTLSQGERVEVELAAGGFGAVVEDVRP
jgi:exodeoxyribonuclease VII large subunit